MHGGRRLGGRFAGAFWIRFVSVWIRLGCAWRPFSVRFRIRCWGSVFGSRPPVSAPAPARIHEKVPFWIRSIGTTRLQTQPKTHFKRNPNALQSHPKGTLIIKRNPNEPKGIPSASKTDRKRNLPDASECISNASETHIQEKTAFPDLAGRRFS